MGSVRHLFDGTGAIAYAANFDPYGVLLEQYVGAQNTDFGFAGEQADDNDLVYLRARYLNPEMGVFPSLDPFEGVIQRAMSLNGYSWVEGRVPNAVDPSGRSSALSTLVGTCGTPFAVFNQTCPARELNGVNILVATAVTETDRFGPLARNDEAVLALMLFQLNYFSDLGDWKLLGTWIDLGVSQSELRIADPPVVGIGGSKYNANFGNLGRVREMRWIANRAIAGHCDGDALRYFRNLSAQELYPQIFAKVDGLQPIANNPLARSEVSINATRKEEFERDTDYPIRYVVRAGNETCDRAIVIGDSNIESAWIEYQCPEGYNAVVGTAQNPDELGTLALDVNVTCKACDRRTRQWWAIVNGVYMLLTESDFQSRDITGYIASCEGATLDCGN